MSRRNKCRAKSTESAKALWARMMKARFTAVMVIFAADAVWPDGGCLFGYCALPISNGIIRFHACLPSCYRLISFIRFRRRRPGFDAWPAASLPSPGIHWWWRWGHCLRVLATYCAGLIWHARFHCGESAVAAADYGIFAWNSEWCAFLLRHVLM